MTENTTANNTTTTTTINGEFHGRYAYCSLEVYNFLVKQQGVPENVAHKIGHAVACDFGAAMKSDRVASEAKHKIGRASKEGILNLREALTTTVKGVSQTFPLRLAHAVQWIGDAGKHYVSYGHTAWQLDEQTDKWLKGQVEAEAKAETDKAQ